MGVKRVAAIDCGTNSIRMLVADLTPTPAGAHLVDVHREMRIVRLGEGVDATGRLSAGALDRTWSALADYAAVITACGVDALRMTATSATRDAANAREFTAMVVGTLGQEPEVITGTAEAELSFRGAVGDLPADGGPFLVFDIGGGSTEFVIGSAGNDGVSVAAAVSRNIGSVRITERTLRTDPPGAAEIADARQWAAREVGEALDALAGSAGRADGASTAGSTGASAGGALASVRRVVAVAGTATTVAADALELPSYDPAKIHLSTHSAATLRAVSDRLLAANRAERAALGFMHPGRVDVIGGGSLILATVAQALSERLGIDRLTVSEHDILDGIALSLA